jgi:hypothetical protein
MFAFQTAGRNPKRSLKPSLIFQRFYMYYIIIQYESNHVNFIPNFCDAPFQTAGLKPNARHAVTRPTAELSNLSMPREEAGSRSSSGGRAAVVLALARSRSRHMVADPKAL